MDKKTKIIAALTKREEEIMEILWKTEAPLTAKEIVQASGSLKINTVQALLRKLLKNRLIAVKDIVYSNTVLARNYVSAITPEEFALAKLTTEYNRLSDYVSKSSLMENLLEQDDQKGSIEEIDELKRTLEEYKERLDDEER